MNPNSLILEGSWFSIGYEEINYYPIYGLRLPPRNIFRTSSQVIPEFMGTAPQEFHHDVRIVINCAGYLLHSVVRTNLTTLELDQRIRLNRQAIQIPGEIQWVLQGNLSKWLISLQKHFHSRSQMDRWLNQTLYFTLPLTAPPSRLQIRSQLQLDDLIGSHLIEYAKRFVSPESAKLNKNARKILNYGIGFRAWKVSGTGTLLATGTGGAWHPEDGPVYLAKCGHETVAPHSDCQCGLHCFYTLFSAEDYIRRIYAGSLLANAVIVFGAIKASGRAIRYIDGMRAEKAEIIGFLGERVDAKLKESIESKYNRPFLSRENLYRRATEFGPLTKPQTQQIDLTMDSLRYAYPKPIPLGPSEFLKGNFNI